MSSCDSLGKILGVDAMVLERLDKEMARRTGKTGILDKVFEENCNTIENTLRTLNSSEHSPSHIRGMLRKEILADERELLALLGSVEGKNEFERAAKLARRIATIGKGFFLKKDFIEDILRRKKPENLLRYLGAASIEEALSKHDATECFSALRFVESDEWMHKMFDEIYSGFTPESFEERETEIRVLGPEWQEVAKKFVAKKHHNVSHLKEFGVIFINPIYENVPGKFLRDFALILHYVHEVEFYSKLFRRYAGEKSFAEKLKMLLRGDVKEVYKVEDGEWLIVQRYLAKENPGDPRLFMPRVNPESLHWLRGERDLTSFSDPAAGIDLRIWHDLDWVGEVLKDGKEEVVSFDLEDNAMSLVSFMEGKEEFFSYHQREAMWTRIFAEYVGGENVMERLLQEHFDEGIIRM
ncbi:MAG: hypothetical protein AAB655_02395 [Patescibacteria group bacterium]